tara:strand:- start:707 stop:1501 length:795 start_codon:yes stop_codon:yes gene_type:complete
MDIIDFIYYILLGLLQGVTEFLPISSSGHLQIISHFGFSQPTSLFITIILHFATALSIVIIFRQKIKQIIFFRSGDSLNYIFKIIIALIPAVLIGLLFEEEVEKIFSENNKYLLSITFLITGMILYCTDKIKKTNNNLTYKIVFLIGVAQAFAILPGVSRSGITICIALFLGLKKSEATSFSFIIFLPLIFGKIIKDLIFNYSSVKDQMLTVNFLPMITAFFITFFVGLLCCRWMIQIVEKNKLVNFGYYCIGLALVLILTSIC